VIGAIRDGEHNQEDGVTLLARLGWQGSL
jgi:hypothetical protein